MKRNALTTQARELLAAALTEALANLDPPLDPELAPEVRAKARTLSGSLATPVVDLQLEALAPGVTGGSRRRHTMWLDVVSSYQTMEPADAQLEALVPAVLDALDAIPVSWTDATRAVRDRAYFCFRITLTMEDRP